MQAIAAFPAARMLRQMTVKVGVSGTNCLTGTNHQNRIYYLFPSKRRQLIDVSACSSSNGKKVGFIQFPRSPDWSVSNVDQTNPYRVTRVRCRWAVGLLCGRQLRPSGLLCPTAIRRRPGRARICGASRCRGAARRAADCCVPARVCWTSVAAHPLAAGMVSATTASRLDAGCHSAGHTDGLRQSVYHVR